MKNLLKMMFSLPLKYTIRGIKCDNHECDFIDVDVTYKDYSQYLNKPCPKCGENLLTDHDYNLCKRLSRFTLILSVLGWPIHVGAILVSKKYRNQQYNVAYKITGFNGSTTAPDLKIEHV